MESDYSAECKKIALDVWKALGAVDAGRVDLKADRTGRICFMEVNPLAGLHPVHSDLPILAGKTGIDYQSLMEMIMKAVLKRVRLSQ
jgi:D-alanine-D-alanine ligase